jgi:hypothetical protein
MPYRQACIRMVWLCGASALARLLITCRAPRRRAWVTSRMASAINWTGFYRRMCGEKLIAVLAAGVETPIGPELIGCGPAGQAPGFWHANRHRLEDANQLMLVAIERTHATVGLRSHANILQRQMAMLAGGK